MASERTGQLIALPIDFLGIELAVFEIILTIIVLSNSVILFYFGCEEWAIAVLFWGHGTLRIYSRVLWRPQEKVSRALTSPSGLLLLLIGSPAVYRLFVSLIVS